MICRSDYDPTIEALQKQLDVALLYICDPKKNTDCSKTHCGGDMCHNTTDIRYAKVDDNGKPIKVALQP